MNKPLQIWATRAFLSLVCGCGISHKEQSTSETQQLIQQLQSFKCPSDPARVEMVKSKYGNLVSKSNESWRAGVFNHMALLPDAYLEYIFAKHKVPVSPRGSGGLTQLGSAGGLDRPEGPERPGKPQSITISAGQPHYLGMLHELGHASQPFVDDVHKTYFKNLNARFSDAKKTTEGGKMWPYPKTDHFEFFAEVVDSYYCSAESRAFMAKTFPRTYQFASVYLVANLNDASNVTPAWKIEHEPDGDEDGDGVLNKSDQCAATVSGASMSAAAGYEGCGAGQYKDGINSILKR